MEKKSGFKFWFLTIYPLKRGIKIFANYRDGEDWEWTSEFTLNPVLENFQDLDKEEVEKLADLFEKFSNRLRRLAKKIP